MKNYVGKIFETVAGKLIVIANDEEYLAMEDPRDGTISFFSYGKDGVGVNHCISYSVTKQRYFEVLDEADSKDENTLDKALWNKFYKMPKVLRKLIIDAYLMINIE